MSQINKKNRFPDARLKGMDEFFYLVQNEPDWKPSPINVSTFKALGIARGKESNAIFALIFLGILDRNEIPTDEFDRLRSDFQGTINKLTRIAYQQLYEIIPVSRMNQQTLVNFFMTNGYSEETAEYQAKLFVQLCNYGKIELPNVKKTFHRARFQKNE